MQALQNPPTLRTLGLVPGARRRAWSVLLVLAIALASFMHVAHSHDADATSIYKQHCTYCGAFDRSGAPPPAAPVVLPTGPAPSFVPAAAPAPVTHTPLRSALQPRAPPSVQA